MIRCDLSVKLNPSLDFYFPCLYRFSVFGKFDICNLYETATSFLYEDGDDIGNSEKKMPIRIMIIMVIVI